jgi:methylated-DNA-[protein]-cysteine S-methyltransferase
MKGLHYILHTLRTSEAGLVWNDEKQRSRLLRIFLSEDRFSTRLLIEQSFPTATPGHDVYIGEICRQLDNYDKGWETNVSMDELLTNYDDGFQQRVWLETCKIARGTVSTYGQVARNIASPGAARAVGTALAKNPFPLIIPCHRVIASNRKLGGFSGGGTTVKRRLLECEGIIFDNRGRICL